MNGHVMHWCSLSHAKKYLINIVFCRFEWTIGEEKGEDIGIRVNSINQLFPTFYELFNKLSAFCKLTFLHSTDCTRA